MVCNHKGTYYTDDDEYLFISPEGLSQKLLKDKNGEWILEKQPYWKVEKKTTGASGVYWEMTDPTGKKYVYGDKNPDKERNATRLEYTSYG